MDEKTKENTYHRESIDEIAVDSVKRTRIVICWSTDRSQIYRLQSKTREIKEDSQNSKFNFPQKIRSESVIIKISKRTNYNLEFPIIIPHKLEQDTDNC